jgi:dimethylaniline monooxygenase (N-oxide forming)
MEQDINQDKIVAKKNVCVIGAGISGLVVTKELREVGINVTCYEMMPIISGVFGSHTWKDGRLTSSTVNTFFSDFPVANRQHFMTWREFCDYLESYCDRFDLRDSIQLNSQVTSAKQVAAGWRINGTRGNFSTGHSFHPQNNHVEPDSFEEEFSHLVVCTGLHQNPIIPNISGLESFTGEIIHSSKYRNWQDFQNKTVVIIGTGESGSDIAGQLAPVVNQLYISWRSSPGTLFPKWIQGNTPDIRDNRITYNLPRLFKSIILRGHRRFYRIQQETPELFKWAAECNFNHNRCSFNSAACKSFGIPEAVVHHGAKIKPTIKMIEGNKVYFDDDTQVEADVLLFCTGFKPTFSFLDESITDRFNCISKLWKHMFIPNFNETLSFIGFARPHQINFLTIAELQARTLASILSGHRQLPSAESMLAMVQADRDFMQKYYHLRAKSNPALVDHLYFTEALAYFIGCNIPWGKVWRKNPKLIFNLMYDAMHGAYHRLQGPGEQWDLAVKTIMETPQFNNRFNAISRWLMLTLITFVAQVMSIVNPEFQSISMRVRKQIYTYCRMARR